MDPSPLAALREAIQALAIAAGLAAWRIERELAALDGAARARLIRLRDPDAPRPPDRLRLAHSRRFAP